MRRFLLVCPHSHVDFRLAELTSVISMLKIGDDLKFRCGGAPCPAARLVARLSHCRAHNIRTSFSLVLTRVSSPDHAAAETPTLRPRSCRSRARQSLLPPWYVGGRCKDALLPHPCSDPHPCCRRPYVPITGGTALIPSSRFPVICSRSAVTDRLRQVLHRDLGGSAPNLPGIHRADPQTWPQPPRDAPASCLAAGTFPPTLIV